MKDEIYVAGLPRGIIIESILAPPNISAGAPLSNADVREALRAQHVFTFVSLHVIITHRCCVVVKLLFLLLPSICVDSSRCLSSPYHLPSLFPPPSPGSEASFGNSLNTSEEELHTAGIMLASKGTKTSLQPISIQIAPAQNADHYHFCSDRYLSRTNLLHLTGRAFVLTQWCDDLSSPPHLSFQVSHRGSLCFYRDRLMHGKMIQHSRIWMQEKQRASGWSLASVCVCLNLFTHKSANLSLFRNFSLVWDLICVYSNSVTYKRKPHINELHFWILKWIPSSPQTAAKLGDTKELESFISMLDQELAGKGIIGFFFSFLTLTLKMKSHQSGQKRLVHTAATWFSAPLPPQPPPPHLSLSSSFASMAFFQDNLHNLQR